MTKRYLTPWTFLNWIVYFKFNINIETFKNSDQVWKQNYKLWAPGPSKPWIRRQTQEKEGQTKFEDSLLLLCKYFGSFIAFSARDTKLLSFVKKLIYMTIAEYAY